MRPAKTHISLGIHPVWSESSLCAQWVVKDPSFLHADREDSDRLGVCPGWSESSLGPHAILLVLSWGSSIMLSCLESQFIISDSAVSPILASYLCAIYRFTDVPEEQEVPVVDDIHEEKIYDDLCSLKSKAGSQVPRWWSSFVGTLVFSHHWFISDLFLICSKGC